MVEQQISDPASLEEIKKGFHQLGNLRVFHKKLVLYGITRLKTKFGIDYNATRGLNGTYLEDMVTEVFTRFLIPKHKQKRNWNKSNPKTPTFEKAIYSAFDSHICNFIKKNL